MLVLVWSWAAEAAARRGWHLIRGHSEVEIAGPVPRGRCVLCSHTQEAWGEWEVKPKL